ncbi:MAG: hypothetical protein HY842_05140 [Bacteroidetes bacterium]|nr:hypothetical protein [Bacteroidota bacterium]
MFRKECRTCWRRVFPVTLVQVTTGTNKINSITDAASATYKAKGFNPGGGAGSYAYDVNGNMTTDPFKAMTIGYNHLNLPKLFTFTGGAQNNTIDILYDAAGTKLRKTVKTGPTVLYTGLPIWHRVQGRSAGGHLHSGGPGEVPNPDHPPLRVHHQGPVVSVCLNQ